MDIVYQSRRGKRSWNRSFFSCDVDFEDLLEVFKARLRTAKRNDNDDDTSLSDNKFFNESDRFEEKTIHNGLIVMDDVSGLAHE